MMLYLACDSPAAAACQALLKHAITGPRRHATATRGQGRHDHTLTLTGGLHQLDPSSIGYGASYTLARQLASTTRPSSERAPFQTGSVTMQVNTVRHRGASCRASFCECGSCTGSGPECWMLLREGTASVRDCVECPSNVST